MNPSVDGQELKNEQITDNRFVDIIDDCCACCRARTGKWLAPHLATGAGHTDHIPAASG
jgi:hypothetical protein